jgi:hypothetical protein
MKIPFFASPSTIGLLVVAAACGCQSSQQTVRIDHGDAVPVAKSGDSTANQAVTTSAQTGTSGSATSLVSQTTSASSISPWSKLFGGKDAPQRVVLPRDDQQSDGASADGAADRNTADDF